MHPIRYGLIFGMVGLGNGSNSQLLNLVSPAKIQKPFSSSTVSIYPFTNMQDNRTENPN